LREIIKSVGIYRQACYHRELMPKGNVCAGDQCK
jgi:hypothetical protein